MVVEVSKAVAVLSTSLIVKMMKSKVMTSLAYMIVLRHESSVLHSQLRDCSSLINLFCGM